MLVFSQPAFINKTPYNHAVISRRDFAPRAHRSDLRLHVFGQDRRTHPSFAPCQDCTPAGGNLQTGHGYTLFAVSSTPVEAAASILLLADEAEVVGIDEAQFFDEGLVDVCNELANRGKRVIVAGLDMDFQGIPFGPMPGLCAIAEDVTKVHAICVRCGALAHVSHRTVADGRRVLLGEKEEYEPLCRDCYNKAKGE